jgi:hypothetical protein
MTTPIPSSNKHCWRDRFKASGIHLGASLVVAMLAVVLVFWLWYPYPYREVSGGRELFMLMVTVDVILGPLITFAVFSHAKPWPVLRRDLGFVVAVQFCALLYGLWAIFVARPVHMVFEFDRFSVVHAVDVPTDSLSKAPTNVQALPLTGPTLLSLRPFKNNAEKTDATLAELQGLALAARPDFWQSYAAGAADVLKASRPVLQLKERFAAQSPLLNDAIAKTGRKAEELVYVPLVGRKLFWTVLLDSKTADVVGFVPLDSF